MTDLSKPLTRIEQYLAGIAGVLGAVPETPLTRIEAYLKACYEGISGVAAKAAENLADTYDPESTYAAGDYVTNEGVLYKALAASTDPAGEFNPLIWESVKVMDEMPEMPESINLKNGEGNGSIVSSVGDSTTTASMSFVFGRRNNVPTYAPGAVVFGNDHNIAAGQNLTVGYKNDNRNSYSVAAGEECYIAGGGIIALGRRARATGNRAVAIGLTDSTSTTITVGAATASGTSSLAIGTGCTASATDSVAIGDESIASHQRSVAIGEHLKTSANSQHVIGKWNSDAVTAIEIVGNGTSANARSNARTLDTSGNEWLAGNLTAAGGSVTIGSTTITETQLQSLLALLS